MQNASAARAYLSDVSAGDKPWDAHRTNALAVANMYQEGGRGKYAERILDCANVLGFALSAKDDGEMQFRLQTARFCRIRLCPTCQWRRSLMWIARFHKALPKLINDHPKLRYIFVTLTVRNCPVTELRQTIKSMNSGWNRLRLRAAFPAVGWVRSLEVTRNSETGEAHPHLHVLMAVKPGYFAGKNYVKKNQWQELWQSVLKVDYLPIVDVKVVKNRRQGESNADVKSLVMTGVLETLKYSVKEQDLMGDVPWLIELTKQLNKMRGVAVGGLFKNYLNPAEPEDLIHADEGEDSAVSDDDPMLFFEYLQTVKRYAQIEPEVAADRNLKKRMSRSNTRD